MPPKTTPDTRNEQNPSPPVPPEERRNAVKAALFFFGAIAFLVILKVVLGY